jgi:methylmalonyl-CoA/ethylmalonyl-CoA epimerase
MSFRSRFHHVGYVVASIDATIAEYRESSGLEWDGLIVHDPLQVVRVTFLGLEDAARIELVEPAGSRSPVNAFLRSGGGLHHVCYEVADLKTHIEHCRGQGCTLVRFPMPAAAFGGRKIAWMITPSQQLFELLQAVR